VISFTLNGQGKTFDGDPDTPYYGDPRFRKAHGHQYGRRRAVVPAPSIWTRRAFLRHAGDDGGGSTSLRSRVESGRKAVRPPGSPSTFRNAATANRDRLRRWRSPRSPKPTNDDIDRAAGNICRCAPITGSAGRP
jgi:isoquinoline 1-oxidoreductase alpha subunit